MDTNWGTAVVIDPRALERLEMDVETLRVVRVWLTRALAFFVGACAVVSVCLWTTSGRVAEATRQAHVYRQRAARTEAALASLAKSHEHILAATEHAPAVGSESWGRRFTVTKYLPRDPRYGKFNTGITSTQMKADPAARIVAVDPKVIPYDSWVWIEDLGWYRAEDCGGAIKGFRLDLLTDREADAMEFGRQERFVIVVPPAV